MSMSFAVKECKNPVNLCPLFSLCWQFFGVRKTENKLSTRVFCMCDDMQVYFFDEIAEKNTSSIASELQSVNHLSWI